MAPGPALNGSPVTRRPYSDTLRMLGGSHFVDTISKGSLSLGGVVAPHESRSYSVFGVTVTQSLEGEIRILRSLFWSDRDPDGLGFAPLADAYRRAGDAKQALELLGDGMDRHPDFTPGHVVAARLYVEQGLFTEAEIAARRVLDLDPENVDALRSLVRALEEEGEAVDAAKVREQLAILDPKPPEHEMSDDSSTVEALEAQEDVVEFDPFALEEILGEEEEVADFAALAPDEPEEAAEEEEVADFAALAPDEAAPDEPTAQIQTRTMADLYVIQGLIDRAIDVYQHLVDDAPDDAGLRTRLEELKAGDRETDVAGGETEANTPRPQAVEEEAEADESGHGEVETLARDLVGSGDAEHEVGTPFAWAEEVSEGQPEVVDGPSIGRFFEDLLSYGRASEQEES
jgi:tetratricopeptide (TPR) repeat protein